MNVLVHEAGDFLGAGVLQHAGEHGGADLAHVQPRKIVVRAGAGEGLHGFGAENMLLRQNMAVCPQPGHLLEASGQGAEPPGGGAHRRIPAQLRPKGLIQLPHLVDAPADDGLHILLPPQQQHGVAGQIPAEQDILRMLEKIGHHFIPDSGPLLRISLSVAALRHGGHQRQVIDLGTQIQVQLFRLLVDFLYAQLSRHNPLQKTAAGVLLVVLGLLAELGQIILLGPLPLNLLPHLLQHRHQGALGDGLQKIPLHTQPDGRLSVLKIVVAGEDNDLHQGEFLQYQLAQGQPVHEGHPDVGNQHVRLCLLDKRQGHLPVAGLAHKGVAALGPGHSVPESLPDDGFVLG